ncbi:phage tail-like protein [Paenibacillus sp. V4I3]|jgi:phage tail-like protein|uniref:Phage tail protein n=2 Tax=Paenibacillus TaxID=44249 RepID=A0ABX1ZHW1_9BACL|nr:MULTISPECIES: phage tail protein [Paenibacillus]MDF2644452.1 phage tail protein [Paenibacillus sp.]KQX56737.1 phage tail protein [Paenibacillus sp. Root444D2]KRE50173.1 phage tail protein [Paenibacillus sp. Soil724D2]MDQ0872884.1 phage tail-like protein [Paenibacillus sp. V4I3]MDQ0891198.1 phage tail-like protein [Paenibacillus sp. V4I9]
MAGERRDPYRNFRFRIEVEGIQQAGFSEISGFDASLSVIEYREGNETITPRKLPGLAKYGNISLKWGVTDSMDMYNWMSESIQGKVSRKTVTIIAINEEGADVATWQVIEAWPSKYSAPSFKGTGNEIAIESLELAHEGMTRTK